MVVSLGDVSIVRVSEAARDEEGISAGVFRLSPNLQSRRRQGRVSKPAGNGKHGKTANAAARVDTKSGPGLYGPKYDSVRDVREANSEGSEEDESGSGVKGQKDKQTEVFDLGLLANYDAGSTAQIRIGGAGEYTVIVQSACEDYVDVILDRQQAAEIMSVVGKHVQPDDIDEKIEAVKRNVGLSRCAVGENLWLLAHNNLNEETIRPAYQDDYDLWHYLKRLKPALKVSANIRAALNGTQVPLIANRPLVPEMNVTDFATGKLYELNFLQKRAVRLALSTDSIACVRGPPGTGKTRVLACVAKSLQAAGKRVLVCARELEAIRSLCCFCIDVGIIVEIPLAKLAEELRKTHGHQMEKMKALSQASPDLYPVIFTTCTGALTKKIVSQAAREGGLFDYVLLDEAGRVHPTQSKTIIPFAARLVLFGDPKQTGTFDDDEDYSSGGPTGEYKTRRENHSWLSDYSESYPGATVTLEVQYRMHPVLAQYCSNVFYGGHLESHPGVGVIQMESPSLTPLVWVNLNVEASKNLSHEDCLKYCWNDSNLEKRMVASSSNRAEALLCLRYIERRLTPFNKHVRSVAIVCAYARQKYLVRELLQRCNERGSPVLRSFHEAFKRFHITVETCDSYQGQEADAVIFCISRANKDGRLGFLRQDPSRINTAVTRARYHLCVFGDAAAAHTLPELKELFKMASRHGKVIDAQDFDLLVDPFELLQATDANVAIELNLVKPFAKPSELNYDDDPLAYSPHSSTKRVDHGLGGDEDENEYENEDEEEDEGDNDDVDAADNRRHHPSTYGKHPAARYQQNAQFKKLPKSRTHVDTRTQETLQGPPGLATHLTPLPSQSMNSTGQLTHSVNGQAKAVNGQAGKKVRQSLSGQSHEAPMAVSTRPSRTASPTHSSAASLASRSDDEGETDEISALHTIYDRNLGRGNRYRT